MTVRYVGPAKDYSGYGEAVRHDIMALLAAGVEVTGKFPRYTPEIADFGALGEKLDKVENVDKPYDTIILHTTPNVYQQYMEKGKYHIARVFWETDKLPAVFAQNIELCDEIWTGSEFNAQALRNSGITKPIHIIPQAIDTEFHPDQIKPYLVSCQDTLKFYSIFEWTERKNPVALLTAYFQAFQNAEKVSLSIKTYVDNFDKKKHEEIDHTIRKLKAKLNLSYYPPVYLYRNLMDRQQIYRFHKTFDIFVSAHRGEGWGIPQMEALLSNHPIISTGCGGIHEYLTDNVDAFLTEYKLVALSENTRNQQWYQADQKWADVDILDLISCFHTAYTKKDDVQKMGINGGKRVRELFAPETIGAAMAHQLKEINYGKKS